MVNTKYTDNPVVGVLQRSHKFELVFAEVFPAEHIADNYTKDNELKTESYKLPFAKREWQPRKAYKQLN